MRNLWTSRSPSWPFLFVKVEFLKICYSCYFCHICYSISSHSKKNSSYFCDFCNICYFLYAFLIAVFFKSFLLKLRKQFASKFLLTRSILDISAGLSTQIGELITRCHTCAKEQPTPREPLKPSSFPARPWERVATDLYDFQGRIYIIVVDYYSTWFDIKELSDETSHSIIKTLKEGTVFATHGIPHVTMSDNGPQYTTEAFRQFAEAYHFAHVSSSPNTSTRTAKEPFAQQNPRRE